MSVSGRATRPRLIGVVHLPPLPGSPRDRAGPAGLADVVARAEADADALRRGGADAVIVENLGDTPFHAERVGPETVAAMTRVALAVRQVLGDLPLGVNVLRNDGAAALAVAAAVGASFVRVNVLTGVMATDQGLVTGRARDLLDLRRRLGAEDVLIAADVLVKHATPLGPVDLADVARDTWHRGGAGALLVTGTGTGRPTDLDDVRRVRDAVPDAPVWVASGVDPAQAPALRGLVDAAVVGTWLHRDGRLDAPVDPERVATLRAALG